MLRLGHHQERRKEIKLTFVNENDIILFQLKGIAFILFFHNHVIQLKREKKKKKVFGGEENGKSLVCLVCIF